VICLGLERKEKDVIEADWSCDLLHILLLAVACVDAPASFASVIEQT